MIDFTARLQHFCFCLCNAYDHHTPPTVASLQTLPHVIHKRFRLLRLFGFYRHSIIGLLLC